MSQVSPAFIFSLLVTGVASLFTLRQTFWENRPQFITLSFLFLFTGLFFDAFAQTIPEKFESLGQETRTIHFTNPLPLEESGGHLQGIQFLEPDKDTFVLSGSSSSYAYYIKIAEGEVKHVEKMDHIPFKHAGGFQLADGYLAVGIEDNSAKDRSKVFIYQASGDQIQAEPTWTIDREGPVMRSTAGCIGIAKQQDHVLVVVGDWDTKHLDFYQILAKQGSESPKGPIASIATAELSKDAWINPAWHSYQNINMIQDRDGSLYLIGLGTDGENKNVADLFEVSSKNGTYHLKKLSSKLFQSDPKVSFRAGAGVHFRENGKLQIISCSSHIGEQGVIQVWE